MGRELALAAGVVVACVLTATADHPPAESMKPPYERLLQGDDAKRADELAERIAKADEDDREDEAIRHVQELLALRTNVQGADHWETVSERWNLEARRKVALLAPEKRAGWRQAFAGASEAEGLLSQGHLARAEALERNYLK